jgi:glucose/arabinose dehydrogenase
MLFVLAMLAPARVGATPLPGFADEIVPGLNDLYGATALAFAPNGWLLVTTKSGTLWLYADGALRSTPALDLSNAVCTESERGLLGVAVDPAFNDNRFIQGHRRRQPRVAVHPRRRRRRAWRGDPDRQHSLAGRQP